MNPSEKEKDEGEMDSITESKPKSAPTDQETETPPTQSGEDSSSQPPTQSGQATSSRPFSQIPSLSTAQRISAMIGEGPVPEFFMMQVQNLPKSPRRKSNLGMNPSGKEKDEMETDSIAESDSESTPTDQEIEKPPTQSGVATSSQPSSQTQSGVATSSRPNQILLTTVQRIAATSPDGNVPAFIRTQLPNLPKSNSGLPPLSPKKPKLTHLGPNPDSDPVPDPGPNPGPNPEPHFQIFVSDSNRLPIAYAVAVRFFPATSPDTSEQTIQLTDPSGHLWPNISYVCFDEEKAFVLTHNWAQYAEKFKLRVRDTLRFTPEGQVMNRFVMQHIPRPESELDDLGLHGYLEQNFLFQVKLGESDVGFGRLMIDAAEVRLHCPGIKGGKKAEMVKLTEFEGKVWYVTMVYSAFMDRYIVMDGWPGFVREHDLVAGDLVRFYYPSSPSHEKHFLVKFIDKFPHVFD